MLFSWWVKNTDESRQLSAWLLIPFHIFDMNVFGSYIVEWSRLNTRSSFHQGVIKIVFIISWCLNKTCCSIIRCSAGEMHPGSCCYNWHPLMELLIFSSEIKRDRSWRDDWWVSDGQNSFRICGYVEKIVASCCATTGKKGRRQQESARHHALIVRTTLHVSANQLSDKQFWLRAVWKKRKSIWGTGSVTYE